MEEYYTVNALNECFDSISKAFIRVGELLGKIMRDTINNVFDNERLIKAIKKTLGYKIPVRERAVIVAPRYAANMRAGTKNNYIKMHGGRVMRWKAIEKAVKKRLVKL